MTDAAKNSEEILKTAKEKMKQGEYKESLALLEQVEDSEPEATFLMGVIYFDGLGVDLDMKRGIDYMNKLTKLENLKPDEMAMKSQALYNLAVLYYRGVGLPKDDKKAIKHWQDSANMDFNPDTGKPYPASLRSQTALGMFHSHPDHHDLKKSLFWHKMAFANGSAESEAVLGVMYMYGFGVKENTVLAYERLLNASIRGNVYGQGYLTAYYYTRQMYFRVIETGSMLAGYDDLEALARCTCSDVENVARGVAIGCFYLALCYKYGYSVPKDMPKAKKLIQKAVHLCPTLIVDAHVQAILGCI